jgi:hypothetical protein
MDLLCPQCLVPMESTGQTARCATHSGEYQILFARTPSALPAAGAPEPPIIQDQPVCAYHASVPAVVICQQCSSLICATCGIPQLDGSHLCPNCASQRVAPPPLISSVAVASIIPAGVRCVQHSNLQATAQCKSCGSFMCQTCAFDLPTGGRICPECATAPPKLSSVRKKLIIASFVAALFSTIAWTAIFSIIRNARDREAVGALGILILLFVPLPSMIGLALGVCTMERRLPNGVGMWLATVWNGLILGSFLLVFVLGLIKQSAR